MSQSLVLALRLTDNDVVSLELKSTSYDDFLASVSRCLLQPKNASKLSVSQISGFEYLDDDDTWTILKTGEDYHAMLQMLESCNSDNDNTWHVELRPTLRSVGDHSGARGSNSNRRLSRDDSDDKSVASMNSESQTDNTYIRGLNPANLRPEHLKNLCEFGSAGCATVYKTLDTSNDRIIATKCIPMSMMDHEQEQVLAELEILKMLEWVVANVEDTANCFGPDTRWSRIKTSRERRSIALTKVHVAGRSPKQSNQETASLRKCHSPYIIDFYAALFMEDSFMLCVEFMDGGSLDRYGRIPENVIGPVTASVLLGLLYLWDLKILHRDIKPANTLVNSEGIIKICDFGVSRRLESSIAKTYVGTKAYMAPERLTGGEYRMCSDIWSYGVTMLELALGRFPFALDSEFTSESIELYLLEKLAKDPMPDFSLDLKDYDPSFVQLLNLCLQRNVEGRALPSQLAQHPFILASQPIDNGITAIFVNNHKK